MRLTPLALPLLVCPLVACSDSSGNRGTRTVTGRSHVLVEPSTRQTTFSPLAFGTDLVYLASEAERNVDLDGDGFLDDQVLFVLDGAADVERGLGLLADPDLVAGERFFAFFQPEAATGDRNGDGDTDERFLFLHDLESGVTADLATAATEALGVQEVLFFTVDEAETMFDWNADGDQLDLVGRFRDARTGVGAVSGLSGDSRLGGVQGRHAVFFEPPTGEVQAFDLDSGALERFPLGAVGMDAGRDFLAFHASEALVGADLNRDGDLADEVVSIFDFLTGFLRATPIARVGDAPYAFTSDFVAFPTAFRGRAGVAMVDIRSAVARLVLLEAADLVGVGERILAEVDEAVSGADWNGDGDLLDRVLHLIDPATLDVVNLGVPAAERLVRGDVAWLVIDEAVHGADLSGDGDLADRVLHRLDGTTGTLENLQLPAGILGTLDERFVLLDVLESPGDRNGDGDTDDRVLHVLDLDRGRTENLQLAVVGSGELSDATFTGVAPVLVREADEGSQDLNDDGDAADTFLFLVRAPR